MRDIRNFVHLHAISLPAVIQAHPYNVPTRDWLVAGMQVACYRLDFAREREIARKNSAPLKPGYPGSPPRVPPVYPRGPPGASCACLTATGSWSAASTTRATVDEHIVFQKAAFERDNCIASSGVGHGQTAVRPSTSKSICNEGHAWLRAAAIAWHSDSETFQLALSFERDVPMLCN
jgi:hypothetical protein